MKFPVSRAFALLAAVGSAALLPQAAAGPLGADTFSAALSIYAGANAPSISGTTPITNFTKQMGEPNHGLGGSGSGGHSAWWTWTPSKNGWTTLDTLLADPASQFVSDTVIAVYTGNTVDTLLRVAGGDQTRDSSLTSMSFFAQAGTTYRIAVDSNNASDTGNVRLRMRHRPLEAARYSTIWQFGGGKGEQGQFTVAVTAAGAISGSLRAGAEKYRFSGVLGVDSYFTATFPRPVAVGETPLTPLQLEVDAAEDQGAALFFVTDGGKSTIVACTRSFAFNAGSPAPEKGYYTARVTPVGAVGTGWLSARVSTFGRVRWAGVMGDGKRVTGAGEIRPSGSGLGATRLVPLYGATFDGAGWVKGEPAFSTSGILGPAQVTYVRPAHPQEQLFPAGFISFPVVSGARYVPPPAGQRAMDFLDASKGAGKLSVESLGAGSPAFQEPLKFSSANLFVFPNAGARDPHLFINPRTGIVTGTLLEPAGTPRKLRGILARNGTGLALEGSVSGPARTFTFKVLP